ncbi:MAG TPA: hypothetical protein VMF90_09810 [Rhizobiaceae bacterium]|nr:hypothetical protein [Rhizobiaceae bacterium]
MPKNKVTSLVNEWDLPEIGLRGLSGADRKRFWDGFVATRPGVVYAWGNTFSRWRVVPDTEFNLSLYITNRSIGLFVRGVRGIPRAETCARLSPRKLELETALNAQINDECPLLRNFPLTTTNPGTWNTAYEWLEANEAEYLAVLTPKD